MLDFAPLVDVLVDEMEKRLSGDDYPVGTKLPSEARLAAEMGVSRPLIREMLARLRERGYIETLNGRGSFVRPRTPAPMLDAMLDSIHPDGAVTYSPDDLYAVRATVETATAHAAADAATADDLRTLTELVEEMTSAAAEAAPERYAVADARFHIAVARATQNPLFPAVLSPIIDVVVNGIHDSVRTFPEGMRGGNQGHRRVLSALLAHDADRAEAAMAEHLGYSRMTFPEGGFERGELNPPPADA